MAYYETAKDYLNDQFRLPLLKAIKENDMEEVKEIIDFFAYKYIELNAFAKGHEDYVKEKYGDKMEMPIMDYIKKYVSPIIEQCDKEWKDCQTIYSADDKD